MTIEESSTFLRCGTTSKDNGLAVLHLKRDLLTPTILRSQDTNNEGYDEGKVTNTRFGSFPHSTLIGVPWGSQIRASAVDTGSRGRRGDGHSKKRKRQDTSHENEDEAADVTKDIATISHKAAVEASSGFVYLLPPTPEAWTASLPHRTQVVYTPDYSYILDRVRARPGSRLLEAGAGSGSFTHAAVRAVFNGYPGALLPETGFTEPRGKVWSFEFHDQRAERMKQEICEHGLDGLVELTHQDVCDEGFQPAKTPAAEMRVNAIFLDLPAPWLTFKHLLRGSESPLDPNTPIHICTFSPCIEQVQKTVALLRQFGWLEIEMVEIAAKRIEVRRERVGLQEEGLRGVNDSPATVDEALQRLKQVDNRARVFREGQIKNGGSGITTSPAPSQQISKQQRLANIRDAQDARSLFKEGRLVTKTELEVKAHTSYLVFAVLPCEWTDSDEKAAQEACANGVTSQLDLRPTSQRQRKKLAKAAAGTGLAREKMADRSEVMDAAKS